MNTALTRSIGFWLLTILSLASAGVGGWLIAGQIGTMTTTLLDGTATGVEVYVGQSIVVVGAALLGAGVIGLVVVLALLAARSLITAPARTSAAQEVRGEQSEGNADEGPADGREDEDVTTAPADETSSGSPLAEEADEAALDDGGQNGSSGSIATATKISVR